MLSNFICSVMTEKATARDSVQSFHFPSEMDEVSEKKKVEETELFLKQNNGQPKYLLKRFSPQENPKETTQLSTQEIKQEKLDINLGLSLGGIYSENSSGKPLTRSSSIIGVLTPKKDHQELDSPLTKSFLSLSRSCSVPTEAEQGQRKASLMALARRRIESTQRFMGRGIKRQFALYGNSKLEGFAY
ncbi:hypothetical protein GH714_043851 [Hevea brasiliensis]|uniref:Ninja-family protein n=1 Tax=Hevea brasiliensis TaxID=3981 RepID=A0A6A6K0J6_HEVBR|nr:hypothetical protein GH714_043851 [Hevea brasiliensis]